MQFHGFQKLTLLDYPEHTAALLFTAGCNLRCPFCHNALLVTHQKDAPPIPTEEIMTYLRKRKGLLDCVVISGGEPLLYPELPLVLREIKALGYDIKIDTNGTFPDRLHALMEEGLCDYVAMDIKNSPEKYAETVGVKNFDLAPVRESVSLLLSGGTDYEFRTTVTAELHEVADIAAIGRWIAGAKRYFLQNFKDSGDLIGNGLHPVPTETLLRMKNAAFVHISHVGVRGL